MTNILYLSSIDNFTGEPEIRSVLAHGKRGGSSGVDSQWFVSRLAPEPRAPPDSAEPRFVLFQIYF